MHRHQSSSGNSTQSISSTAAQPSDGLLPIVQCPNCGIDVKRFVSGTIANPQRIFYKCINYKKLFLSGSGAVGVRRSGDREGELVVRLKRGKRREKDLNESEKIEKFQKRRGGEELLREKTEEVYLSSREIEREARD